MMEWIDISRVYLGLGLLALGLLIFIHRRATSGPLAHLPGPWYSKYTEWVLIYHWLKGQRPLYVHKLHQIYGPVVRIGPDEADISDLAAKQQIYTVKETFIKTPWYEKLVAGAKNVFSVGTDVDFHRRHRRLLSGPLSETSLKTVEPIVTRNIDLCVQKMAEEMDKRGAVEVFKWFLFLTTDVIGELTFGESFRMLEQGKKNDYITNLERVGQAGALRPVFPWLLKLSRYVTVPVLSEAAATAPQIRKYSEESMQRYRSLVAADPYNVKPSLFTKLFLAKDEEKLTFNEVRDDAVTYIIAGSDTTAITLTYLVWCVTRDAALRDDLVREVQALPDDFSHQHVHHLPCLNMVIEETLRLYSPLSSALPRLVPREGAEIGGYRFPGGATVATQAYTMHRDPVIFPQPERFDPGRWAQPTKAMKEALLAFGGGSRVCLGIHLARMELRVTVAKFFRTFPNAVHSSVEGMTEEEMEPAMYFLLSPKGKRCLIKAW